MRKMQRLIVCLDGTWNTQADSTNVLHHFAMTLEGAMSGKPDAETVQTRYYHKGVGTSALDSITGGGFGVGLEGNVRDAYNWLMANFHDAPGTKPDQIYIFGFSRGAYTARSLVGFISMCGLLRRGAPVSVNELWENYAILGRRRERRTSTWESLFGEAESTTRRITDLVCDPWRIDAYEERRKAEGFPPADGITRVPGQLVDGSDLRDTEKLLVRCSRRVKITYLGVYDTVGALGMDALAIPGLRSKLATHHNMRATMIIRHCRHALALDEHRSSFDLTPFLEYEEHGLLEDDLQGRAIQTTEASQNPDATTAEADAEKHWEQRHSIWRDRIEQRWFIGAHSNIGGGYPSNELAQLAFKWVLEGATNARLGVESFTDVTSLPLPLPRDSYTEFARPFWTEMIRGKRWYRRIDPPPVLRGNPVHGKYKPKSWEGFSLLRINEHVDETVVDAYLNSKEYRPPNLVDYARRKLRDAAGQEAEGWQYILNHPPMHPWLGKAWSKYLILVLWATFAGIGLLAMNGLFSARPAETFPLWLVCAAGFLFALIDWGESRANFSLAVGPPSARWQAFLDSIYWARTIGFVLFVFGAVTAFASLWLTGWHADKMLDAIWAALGPIERWGLAAVAAGVGVLVANGLDRAPSTRQTAGLQGVLAGIPAAALVALVVVLAGWLMGEVFTPLLGHGPAPHARPAPDAPFAGLLLLLQLGCGYLFKAFSWGAEPLSAANLDSIVWLQLCSSPDAVDNRLEIWRTRLACRWKKDDRDKFKGPAALTMHEILRGALWRDIFGYIPLYTGVLVYGLWFAAQPLGWNWLHGGNTGVRLWIWLPVIAAIADLLEDTCHLRYVQLHEHEQPTPGWLPRVSWSMSMVKFGAFTLAAALTVGAVAAGSLELTNPHYTTGWRGTVALLLFIILASVILIKMAVQIRRISLNSLLKNGGSDARV